MIVFAKADGTIMEVVSSPVYQGSNLNNSIYFVAPFSRLNSVTVSFKLPNGINTQSYPMTGVSELEGVTDKLGTEYSVWEWQVANAEITQYAGVCLVQFGVYLPNGQLLTTSRTSFEVQAGVLPDLPPKPSPDVYALILRYLNQLDVRTQNVPNLVASIQKVPGTDNAFIYTLNNSLKSAPIVIGAGSDPPAYVMAAYTGEIAAAAWDPILNGTTVTSYKAVIPAATHGQMKDGATVSDLWVEFGEVQNAETENPSVNDALEQYTIDAAGNITITVTQRMDLAVKVWNGKGIKGEKGDPSLTCVYAIDWDGGSNQFSATVSDFNRAPLVGEKFVAVLKVDDDNLSVGSCIVQSVTNNQLVTGTILESHSIVGAQGLVYPYIYMTDNIGTVPYSITLQATDFNRRPIVGEKFTLFVLNGTSIDTSTHYLAQALISSMTDGSNDVTVRITYQTKFDGKQGPKGDKGDTGDKGSGVTSTTINYATSTSGTTIPTTWQSTIPTVNPGEYLWTRFTFIYEDLPSRDSYTVAYQGRNGDEPTAPATPTTSGTVYGSTENNVTALGYNAQSNAMGVAIGLDANARSTADIAIGAGALTSTGGSSTNSSIAIGRDARVNGYDAIAIGRNSYMNAPYSAAIGVYASAVAHNSVALGYFANARGISSIAIGTCANTGTLSQGFEAMAIGTSAVAEGNDSIAFGVSARSFANTGIAIGKYANTVTTHTNSSGSTVACFYPIALGYNSNSASSYSIAIGTNSWVNSTYMENNYHDGEGSIAIGFNARVPGANSAISIGANANAASQYAIALGTGANVARSYPCSSTANAMLYNGIAIGTFANVQGSHSIAIGNYACVASYQCSTSSSYFYSSGAIAIGTHAGSFNSSHSIAIGTNSNVNTSIHGIAIGNNAVVTSANNSIAIGMNTHAKGPNAVTLGTNVFVYGTGSMAIGSGAKVGLASTSKSYALAIGYLANVNFSNSIAIGYNAQASAANQITLGGSGITSLRCAVQTISGLSDERTKEEIELANTARCLEDVEKLPVKRFKFRDWAKPNPIDVHRTGFIAQDVEKVFPKDVEIDPSYFPVLDENNNPVMEDDIDENGNPVMEDVYDEQGNPVMEDEIDVNGNLVYESLPIMEDELDEQGNPVFETVTVDVLDEENNPVYKDVIDDSGNVIGQEIQTTTEQRIKQKPKLKIKQRIKQRIRQREKQFVIEDCKKISMHDGLPTLWGAVQYLSQKVKELEKKLSEAK